MQNSFINLLLFFVFAVQPLLYWFLWHSNEGLVMWWVNAVIVLLITRKNKVSSKESIVSKLLSVFHMLNKHYFFSISTIVLIISSVLLFAGLVTLPIFYGLVAFFVVCFLDNLNEMSQWEIYFWKRILFPKDFLFWISIAVGVILYIVLGSVALYYKIFVSILVWFTIFVLAVYAMKLVKYFNFWKLWSTKIYLIALIFSLGTLGFGVMKTMKTQYLTGSGSTLINFLFQDLKDNIDLAYQNSQIFFWFANSGASQTGMNTVISGNSLSGLVATGLFSSGTSFIETETWSLVTGLVSSWENQLLTGKNLQNSGQSLSWSMNMDKPSWETAVILPKGNLTYEFIIPYLIDQNNIPLSQKKNIAFDNFGESYKYYNQFKTAYYEKMIGRNVKPGGQMKCETWLVLRGIAEWRNVQYSSKTVFDAYRAEATKRGLVNWCPRDGFVTAKNL